MKADELSLLFEDTTDLLKYQTKSNTPKVLEFIMKKLTNHSHSMLLQKETVGPQAAVILKITKTNGC